jgi:hypothetical protein
MRRRDFQLRREIISIQEGASMVQQGRGKTSKDMNDGNPIAMRTHFNRSIYVGELKRN